jgi:RNA polymerase sigma-70 factor (ECF subfamily)
MQNVLFESLYGKMLVVAMRYTKNKDQAEDFVIEGFMKAYEKLHTFKDKHKISSWVGRIIANTAIDYIRKNKHDILGVTDFNGLDYDLEFSTEDDEYDFENVEYIKTIPADVVLKEVQSLSPMYKTVFNMYIFEEYTHKEIAEILGISEGTSKSDLSKAKEVLRNNLHRYVVERDRRSSLILSLANNNA